MKLIIASDIHGSFKYAKKLKDQIDKHNPDKIILLGDILYHGARNPLPEEYSTLDVTSLLNEYSNKIIAVRGNCDSEVDDMVLNFDTREDYKIVKVDGVTIYLSHGHLNEKYKDLFQDQILLNGHTHVYNLEGNIINPGSVGIPKENPEHTYILYEDKVLKLIDLDTEKILGERTL